MECLHCGDCCLRLSPLGNPCPKIVQKGTFYFCSIYPNRPMECVLYKHPMKVCPIGMDKLGITTTEEVRVRLETGYAMLKYDEDNPQKALDILYNNHVRSNHDTGK